MLVIRAKNKKVSLIIFFHTLHMILKKTEKTQLAPFSAQTVSFLIYCINRTREKALIHESFSLRFLHQEDENLSTRFCHQDGSRQYSGIVYKKMKTSSRVVACFQTLV